MNSRASGTSQSAADSDADDKIRVLLVARRFWPLTDDSAGRLAALAEGLRRGGMVPTILTARYSNAWPVEFSFREIDVLRPFAAPRRDWASGIYQRNLHRWLRENAAQFDVLYADAMRDEAAAVVESGETLRLPTVVRCGGSGCNGDWINASTSRHARRVFNISLRANGLVAATATATRALISAGAKREKIHRIVDGIPPAFRREKSDTLAARAALAAINSDLRVPSSGRVVMVSARFESYNNLMTVAQALAPLCEADNNLKLWFIGDGPQRESIHHFLQDQGIRTSAALPGSFWHIDELTRAADLVLFPSDCDSMEQRLPQAISGGVPIAVVDTPETRAYFGERRDTEASVLTFRADDQSSLRSVVESVFADYGEHQRRAIVLRNTLRKLQAREQSVDAHHKLFLRLSGKDSANARAPMAKALPGMSSASGGPFPGGDLKGDRESTL